VEANITGGHGSRRAVALSDDDDDENYLLLNTVFLGISLLVVVPLYSSGEMFQSP
jgi:hypothetical protein